MFLYKFIKIGAKAHNQSKYGRKYQDVAAKQLIKEIILKNN